MKNPRPSQKIGRLPVAPSIPSQHVVIVANNSDKFGFGVGAVRFPHYEPPENPGPAKYPESYDRLNGKSAATRAAPMPRRTNDLIGSMSHLGFGSKLSRFTKTSGKPSPSVGTYDIGQTLNRPLRKRGHRSAVVIHEVPKMRLPSPTRYNIPKKPSTRPTAGEAVFRSDVSRFPKDKMADGPFPWSYNVNDSLLHPKAPTASSIRNKAHRLMRPPEAENSWLSSLMPQKADLERPTKPLPESRPKLRNAQAFRREARIVHCVPSSTSSLPGPGAYDLSKYSSIGEKGTPVTETTLKNLKRAQELVQRHQNKCRNLPVKPVVPTKLYDTRAVIGRTSFNSNMAGAWL